MMWDGDNAEIARARQLAAKWGEFRAAYARGEDVDPVKLAEWRQEEILTNRIDFERMRSALFAQREFYREFDALVAEVTAPVSIYVNTQEELGRRQIRLLVEILTELRRKR